MAYAGELAYERAGPGQEGHHTFGATADMEADAPKPAAGVAAPSRMPDPASSRLLRNELRDTALTQVTADSGH